MTTDTRSIQRDLLLLFIAIGLLFGIGLGARPYLIPSEARYIELPRQMLVTGDWLTPRINGVPYFEKPPLFYWMQAVVMNFFGSGEFAGRFVTALLSTLTCLLTYAVGRMLYGRRAGLLAAGVLATSLMGYGLSRVATLDIPVSFFLTAALACFLAAQHSERKKTFYYLMYVCAALAMMTKGLLGIVIPGIVIGAWILITRQWNILKEACLITGTLLFLAIVTPWHFLMAQKHPEFLNFYFIHEHFTRFTSNEHKRTAPWWFFIAITWVGLLPWTGLLSAAYKKLKMNDPSALFMALWIVLPLIFYSSSHSKLLPYIFPIFPPLAMLLGNVLADLWDKPTQDRALRISALLLVAVVGCAAIISQFLPIIPGKLAAKINLVAGGITPLMLAPIMLSLVYAGYAAKNEHPARILIKALALFGIVTGLSANYMVATLDPNTTKPLTTLLNQKLQPDDMVVAYNTYWQDLPVYLNRNITVTDWTGELNFGVTHYPQTHDWMIPTTDFWPRCAAEKHAVYVFMHEDMVASLPTVKGCALQPMLKYGKTVLMERKAQ